MQINTYGFDITEVTKYLSDDMADRFVQATLAPEKEENQAFMQACYSTLMQMKAVTSTGKMEISDGAILDAYNLLLGNEVQPIQ